MVEMGMERDSWCEGAGEVPAGGASPHLAAVRVPILRWLPAVDLPVLADWFALLGAEQAARGGPPEPAVEARAAALVADVAWLGDHLAWLGVYRDAAILTPRDHRLAALAAAAAGSLVEPLAALTLHAGAPPDTWNEEEALRQTSRLRLPERYRDGLEWMASLAYRTGIYYEPAEIDPAELVPGLVEAATDEALVLARAAALLAEEAAARAAGTTWTLRNLAAALQLVGIASSTLVGRSFPRWRRRPAVAGRRA